MFTIEYEKGTGYRLLLDGNIVETFEKKKDAKAFAKSCLLLAQAGNQSAEETVKQIIDGNNFVKYMEGEIFK